jgi:hypothetical protein
VNGGKNGLLALLGGQAQNLVEGDLTAPLAHPPLGLTAPAREELDGVLGLKVDLDLDAVLSVAMRAPHGAFLLTHPLPP